MAEQEEEKVTPLPCNYSVDCGASRRHGGTKKRDATLSGSKERTEGGKEREVAEQFSMRPSTSAEPMKVNANKRLRVNSRESRADGGTRGGERIRRVNHDDTGARGDVRVESMTRKGERKGNGLYRTDGWSAFRVFSSAPVSSSTGRATLPYTEFRGPSLIVFHSFLRPFHFVTVRVPRRPRETFTVPHGWAV